MCAIEINNIDIIDPPDLDLCLCVHKYESPYACFSEVVSYLVSPLEMRDFLRFSLGAQSRHCSLFD